MYFENTIEIKSVIEREKTIKGWTRTKKVPIIESMNSDWKDLSEEWYNDSCIVD